jgi:uncharacterized membrane protein YeiH
VTPLSLLDIGGTIVFALGGALLGTRKDFDVVGVAALAVASGLGGGVIRDLVLGAVPPAAIRDQTYLAASLLAGLAGFIGGRLFERGTLLLNVLDALGLSFFAVAGTLKSVDAGLGAVSAVLLGVLSAVGGGMTRDLLAGEPVAILRSELYALAALTASVTLLLFLSIGLDSRTAVGAAMAAGVSLRLLAIWRRWHAPRPSALPGWFARTNRKSPCRLRYTYPITRLAMTPSLATSPPPLRASCASSRQSTSKP